MKTSPLAGDGGSGVHVQQEGEGGRWLRDWAVDTPSFRSRTLHG